MNFDLIVGYSWEYDHHSWGSLWPQLGSFMGPMTFGESGGHLRLHGATDHPSSLSILGMDDWLRSPDELFKA